MMRARSAVTIFTLTVFVAGCGQGSRVAPTGSSPVRAAAAVAPANVEHHRVVDATIVSPAAAARQADAACRLISAQRSLIKIKTATDFNLALPRIVIFQQKLVTDLHDINSPASRDAGWREMVGDAEVLANAVLELQSTERSGNTKAVPRLLSIFGQARLKMRATAARLGLKDCARY